MTKDRLNLDYETYSEADLTTVGSSVYSKHPSTEVLMAAFALNRGPVQQWDKARGEPIPRELAQALASPDVEKWAWNASFEMQITQQLVADVPIEQWRDTMVQAMHCSLPGKLEAAGPVVGLSDDHLKDRGGKALMRKFSFPRKPTKNDQRTRVLWHEAEEDYDKYLTYNRRDVVAERGVLIKLAPHMMSDEEWELWHLDQHINRNGLPINLNMVHNAIRIYEQALEEGFARMRDLTGLANPNSNQQILPWLQAQGYMFDDLKAAHVKTAALYFDEKPDHWSDQQYLDYQSNWVLDEVLHLRLETSRSSIKKYYALARATDADGLLRNTLQMNGAARTGRWAGRIFQPQNLPRPEKRFEKMQPLIAHQIEVLDHDSLKLIHGNVFDVLASGLRPAAQAPDGYMFYDADLSAIENRVLGWLSGCDKILDVFRSKRDPYISFACYLYDKPYDELWHEYKVLKNSAKRTIGKPGTLGCGYGMGPGERRVNASTGEVEGTGLLGYAWNMGVSSFTPEDSKLSVDIFRREFVEVKEYWYDMERAMRRAIKTGKPVEHAVNGGPLIRFVMSGPFLKVILPSGRPLYYLRPRIEPIKTPWGAVKMQITYEGLNDKKQWVRQHTTPGKIVENVDQAISRDLLVYGMKLARARGLDMRLHVHDQILGLTKIDKAEEQLTVLKECMEESPWWADGLPLGSEGFTTKVFMKD
jgi:DNA polymerase